MLGVLPVPDRLSTGRSTLKELELVVQFAGQAALALDLGEAGATQLPSYEAMPTATLPRSPGRRAAWRHCAATGVRPGLSLVTALDVLQRDRGMRRGPLGA
jgi:hypothetical protein